jgi:AsmA-like C-terminal region
MVFRMHMVIPSGEIPFLKRIQLNSDFRILDGRFTNPGTQSRLSKISERPEQKQPDDRAPAALEGQVTLADGVAHFKQLSVQDGDASAQFRGKYSLIDERVNLHGRLRTEASLTKTTSGIKAVFAKALAPVFKKGPHAKVIPVRIGGTYRHPSFGLDLDSNM